jgi:hypothetical protein
MYSQALEQFAKGRQLSGDQRVLISLYGHALAVSGDAGGARKALADLQNLSQNVVSSAPRRPLESPPTTPRAEQGSSAPKSFPSHRRKGLRFQTEKPKAGAFAHPNIDSLEDSRAAFLRSTPRKNDNRDRSMDRLAHPPRQSVHLQTCGLTKKTQCAQAPLGPVAPEGPNRDGPLCKSGDLKTCGKPKGIP